MKSVVIRMALSAIATTMSLSAYGQNSDIIGPSPYNFITDSWMQTFAEEGMTFGGTSGVYVQNKGRIFFLQRGETRLPNPIPQSYAGFPASLGWNVLQGRGRVWQNVIYVKHFLSGHLT